MAAVWVLRLVFITVTVTSSLGFVLRRRNWDNDAVDSGLAEAIPVLRQERRRLEERPSPKGVNSYWEPQEEEQNPGLDLESRLVDNTEFLESLLGDNDEEGQYYLPEVGFGDRDEEDREDNVIINSIPDSIQDITQSPVDIRNLETIFEPSEAERLEEEEEGKQEKKSIPRPLGGPGYSWSKRSGIDTKQYGLAELIEKTAEKLALENDDNGAATAVPVSDAELEEVLRDEDGDEVVDEEEREGEEEEYDGRERELVDEGEEEDDIGDEEFLPPMVIGDRPHLKIKRSRRSDIRDIHNAAIEQAEDRGSIAREYIRRFLELEDDENTNLANALNLATMAQVHRDDKLVVPEAKYIKKAIEDEEAVQQLRVELGRDSQQPTIVAAAEAIAKRQSQDFDQDINEALQQQEEEEPEIEEDTHEDIQYLPSNEEEEDNMIENLEIGEEAASKLAQSLWEYIAENGPLDDDILDEEEQEEEQKEATLQRGRPWRDAPLEQDQNDVTGGDWQLNPLIRKLYQRYSDSQMSKRDEPEVNRLEERLEYGPEIEQYVDPLEEDDEEIAERDEVSPREIEEIEAEIEEALTEYMNPEENINEEDICPALRLVDGCQYAVRDLHLKLDNEALDLCNRHQLCYACGAAHGMTAQKCDNGYLQEANRLCAREGDNGDCNTDAAGLFVLMLESHRFKSHIDNRQCQNPCTMDYIVGLDTK